VAVSIVAILSVPTRLSMTDSASWRAVLEQHGVMGLLFGATRAPLSSYVLCTSLIGLDMLRCFTGTLPWFHRRPR